MGLVHRGVGQGYQDRAKVADNRANAVEEMATFAAAQVIEEYKDSYAFMADTTVAVAGIYVLGFDDYKAKVDEAYLNVNLHRITPASGV